MTTQTLIKAILDYFETHRASLVTAGKAIEDGNSSLAHEILRVTVKNIDIYVKKLEAISQ